MAHIGHETAWYRQFVYISLRSACQARSSSKQWDNVQFKSIFCQHHYRMFYKNILYTSITWQHFMAIQFNWTSAGCDHVIIRSSMTKAGHHLWSNLTQYILPFTSTASTHSILDPRWPEKHLVYTRLCSVQLESPRQASRQPSMPSLRHDHLNKFWKIGYELYNPTKNEFSDLVKYRSCSSPIRLIYL